MSVFFVREATEIISRLKKPLIKKNLEPKEKQIKTTEENGVGFGK